MISSAWKHLNLPAVPSFWQRHGLVLLLAAAGTAALECAVLVWAMQLGLSPGRTTVLVLMAGTLWVGLAAGPLAAGSADLPGALARAVILADASVVVLIATAIVAHGAMDWSAALKVYLLWACQAVTAGLCVCLARPGRGRVVIAICMSLIAAIGAGGLFWSPGLLAGLGSPGNSAVAAGLLQVNPLIGMLDALGNSAHFIWFEQPIMYGITRVGQDVFPPRIAWWMPAIVWGSLAAVAGTCVAARAAWRWFYYGT